MRWIFPLKTLIIKTRFLSKTYHRAAINVWSSTVDCVKTGLQCFQNFLTWSFSTFVLQTILCWKSISLCWFSFLNSSSFFGLSKISFKATDEFSFLPSRFFVFFKHPLRKFRVGRRSSNKSWFVKHSVTHYISKWNFLNQPWIDPAEEDNLKWKKVANKNESRKMAKFKTRHQCLPLFVECFSGLLHQVKVPRLDQVL